MKMQLILVASIAALFAGCSSSMGNEAKKSSVMMFDDGKNTKKEFTVDYFSKIKINGSAEIRYVQTSGGKPHVRIEGTSKDIENTSVTSDGSTLLVSQSGGSFINWNGGDAVVTVCSPDLTAVEINGSGDFKSKGTVDTDNISIWVKGSGEVDFSNIICDNASIEIYGSGDVSIDKLTAQRHTDISVKGSGEVDVAFWQSGSVECTVTGSGDVKLKGTVKSLSKDVTGSGEISSEKLKKW